MNDVCTFLTELLEKNPEFDYRGKFHLLCGDDTPTKAAKAYIVQKLNIAFPAPPREKKEG